MRTRTLHSFEVTDVGVKSWTGRRPSPDLLRRYMGFICDELRDQSGEFLDGYVVFPTFKNSFGKRGGAGEGTIELDTRGNRVLGSPDAISALATIAGLEGRPRPLHPVETVLRSVERGRREVIIEHFLANPDSWFTYQRRYNKRFTLSDFLDAYEYKDLK